MELKGFIKNLKELVEIEREAQIEATLSELRGLSGEERERKGRAILKLKGRILGEEFGYKLVKFGRKKQIETNINVGDLVLISRGNPLKSDLVGVVTEKGNRYITVALENVPEWALKDVRIDLYANDITFRRWIENLDNLSEMGIRALEFALGIEKPEEPNSVEFEPFDKGLNESQKEAVSSALGSDDFFLIHGPFGTGKTRTLAEIIRQEVERGNKVLATAESNVAVDNLVELLKDFNAVRIGHPSRVTPDLRERTLSAMLRMHERYREIEDLRKKAERLMHTRDRFREPVPALRRGLSDEEIFELAEKGKGARGISHRVIKSMAEWIKINRLIDEVLRKARALEDEIADEIVKNADVVLTTNSTAHLLNLEFDVAVIDEATQSTISSTLIPINRAKRFVLAGDHKQLPPTVLKAEELSRTLFEMLIERWNKAKMLEVQYRMNEKLMEFPNREFYGGKLRTHESVRRISLRDLGVKSARWRALDPEEPLVFIDTSRCPDKWERQKKGSTSRENPLEAEIVKKVVSELKKMGVKGDLIGVITPYEDQVDLIRQLSDAEVNTVDGYQGREKEVIVVSFVRSNREKELGFLKDLRRLNVALTRARRKLILIGDSETLSAHETYARLVNFIRSRGHFSYYC